jgi:hypothetical protein
MMRRLAAALVVLLVGAAGAMAQVSPAPLAPPTSPVPVPAPPSPMSPILTNPGLALQPFGHAGATPGGTTLSPLDQQRMQSYRNQLNSDQRALDRQGVSPGSEQYREIQQQLNQLNGGR